MCDIHVHGATKVKGRENKVPTFLKGGQLRIQCARLPSMLGRAGFGVLPENCKRSLKKAYDHVLTCYSVRKNSLQLCTFLKESYEKWRYLKE